MTDRGVVVLTDPNQMKICELLAGGQLRPKALSSELGVSSSSLHFILDKMVEKDILVKCRTGPGKKTVVYSLCSDTVLIGYDPPKNPIAFESRRSLGHITRGYLISAGIDAKVLEKGYSEALAEFMTRQIQPCRLEEAIFVAKRLISDATGYRFNVYAVNPLTLIIDGDQSLRALLDMTVGSFAAMIRRLSGIDLRADSIEEQAFEGSVRYRAVFGPAEEPHRCRSVRMNGEVQSFAVVEKGGWTKAITSGIQVDVMRLVSATPSGMQDIMSSFDLPRSTLSYNIGKLIEEGMLEFAVDEYGSSYYYTDYRLLLAISDSPKRYEDVDLLSEGEGFMDGYLRYIAS
ncbi:MAG: hypothetical protein IKR86_07755 [Candidatus Methanomethylophilaceae archaeon]|nr:hypothetical protein [Candidatus Methanomethylophilaceae archaeon]